MENESSQQRGTTALVVTCSPDEETAAPPEGSATSPEVTRSLTEAATGRSDPGSNSGEGHEDAPEEEPGNGPGEMEFENLIITSVVGQIDIPTESLEEATLSSFQNSASCHRPTEASGGDLRLPVLPPGVRPYRLGLPRARPSAADCARGEDTAPKTALMNRKGYARDFRYLSASQTATLY